MSAARIAWFSPLPPARTGVAACSAELVAALAGRGYLIDVYPETRAHDFPWIQRQRPYDRVVYQFGNSSHHDYIWPYALRYPGLTVLHDTHLHHARAALLLREKRRDDYRRELAWCEPGASPDVAELAIAGFDSRLFYEWPMVRSLVDASRAVAVHGEPARRELIDRLAGPSWPPDRLAHILSLRLGHGQLVSPEQEAHARVTMRRRYGIQPDAIVFGVFGGLSPEKRVPRILAAFRATLPYAPHVHLLLGGAPPRHADFSPADFADIADRVTLTGYVDDGELTDHIAAVDVSLNLRWPTAREISGPWLRALAAGKPTVIVDLLQLVDVPSLDPRTWRTAAVAPGPSPRSGAGAAVAVAIDIVDEDHSLRLAMRRLAGDAGLRAQLGRAGRDYWQREHSVEAMADDYERAMRVGDTVTRAADAPTHLRPDGDERLRALLGPFGADAMARAGLASAPALRPDPPRGSTDA